MWQHPSGYPQGGAPPQGYGPPSGGYGGPPPGTGGGYGAPPTGGPYGGPPPTGYPGPAGRGGPPPSAFGPPASGAYSGYPPPSAGGGYPPQSGYPSSQGGYPPYQGPPPQQQSYQPAWAMQYYDRNDQRELQELRKWFASVDRDGSGSISATELANVAVGGVRLGLDTAIKLVRIFDVDGNGEIDFQEYAALHKFLLSMQATFSQGDKDRNGRLDANEIHTALISGGFNMSYQSSRALYNKFNTTGYGLDMGQFVGLCAHVAMTKSSFEYRDRERRGYIALTFDQLLEFSAGV